jgi:hypothetical protein
MSEDGLAKLATFTFLLGIVAYGSLLPWSFFFVSAFLTALAFAVKRSK